MNRLLCQAVLAVASFTLGTQNAAAQPQTYLYVPGIPGDSAVVGRANWIDVFSVAQGFGGTSPSACTVAVAKGLDRSGPPLWAAAVTGQTFTEIIIDITRAGEKPLRFYELKLTNARVTAISSVPSDLAEHVTISGTAAKLTYWPQNPDGTLGGAISATLDCALEGPTSMPAAKSRPRG
jgi:type VI protein secretion system component Hcp